MQMSVAPPGPSAPPVRGGPWLVHEAWVDGLLAALAGALVLVLGFAVGDRIAGRDLMTPSLLGAIVLRGPAADAGTALRELGVGLWLLLAVSMACAVALTLWVSRLRRFPSAGSGWLVCFLCLGLAMLALDRATGGVWMQRLGPWRLLGALTPAAAVMPLVLWARRPRLIANRRDLWDDEP